MAQHYLKKKMTHLGLYSPTCKSVCVFCFFILTVFIFSLLVCCFFCFSFVFLFVVFVLFVCLFVSCFFSFVCFCFCFVLFVFCFVLFLFYFLFLFCFVFVFVFVLFCFVFCFCPCCVYPHYKWGHRKLIIVCPLSRYVPRTCRKAFLLSTHPRIIRVYTCIAYSHLVMSS